VARNRPQLPSRKQVDFCESNEFWRACVFGLESESIARGQTLKEDTIDEQKINQWSSLLPESSHANVDASVSASSSFITRPIPFALLLLFLFGTFFITNAGAT
jgi:hypothetical protein